MSGRRESYGDSRVAGSSQAFSFLHAGDGRALNPQQRSSFPFCGDGSKEQLLTRLNDPDLQYVHSSQSAITTTLSIGTDTAREMDGGNLYSAGCWSWGPKIDCPAEAPRDGRGQATSSGGKRKRAGKGSALKEDLGSSLVLGQGSSPIDIRPSQGAASFSGGNFCFDIDSPTALSLGQMDPISESPDSQGSFLGSSVRSRASDGFLSIGSGCDGLLFSQLDCNQSRESRDSGSVYNQPGVDYNLNSGVQLQLGQRGNLGESVTRGGRSFEGTRRGGLSRHMEKSPGFILELGSMGNASGQSREGQNLSSMRESQSQSGMLLELGLSENVLDNRDSVRASGGPVPVLDEGSSSARWSNSGGFMPSLLMGSPHLGPPCSQLHGEHLPKVPRPAEPVLECHLNRVEQELPMSMRASTSCTTSTTSASAPLSEKVSKVCKFRGCGKGARGASGLCIAHGGGRRCEKQGCNKGAEGRTVYCKAHGGGRRCQKLGCTKSAEGKTDYCIGHGGGRRCSSEGCSKAARGRSGLCIRHGGGKRCQIEGCTKSAEGYSGLCISHGGGRRCQFQGCTKGAQGSTMFCKAHGGGKRCMIAGCNKGAEGSTPLCKGHGGGKRCMHEGGGICSKSVHGGTAFCVAHGGGKRCAVEGCSKSARGRTDHCVRHGGGKRCKFEACGKSAQGSTDFCKAHGGGKRCQWGVEGSPFFAYASDGVSWAGGTLKPEPCERFARGKTGLCAAHSGLVHDTRVHAGSVIGPGLSPGLFRGLVPGSALAKGTADPSGSTTGLTETASGDSEMRDFGESGIDSSEDDLSGMETANANSWAPPITGATESAVDSGLSVVGSALGASSRSLPQGTSSMTGALVTPSAALLSVSSGSYPTSQSPLLGSLIPPKVLVPLSMQKLGAADIISSSQGRLGEVLTSRTSDDGAFNMNSLSLPEGRVHGGGLMEMLARDPGIGNKIDQHLNASKVSSQHHWQSGALFSPTDESP